MWGVDPITMPTGIDFSLQIGRGESLFFDLFVGCANTKGIAAILGLDPQGIDNM